MMITILFVYLYHTHGFSSVHRPEVSNVGCYGIHQHKNTSETWKKRNQSQLIKYIKENFVRSGVDWGAPFNPQLLGTDRNENACKLYWKRKRKEPVFEIMHDMLFRNILVSPTL